jgi:hypothetical protein
LLKKVKRSRRHPRLNSFYILNLDAEKSLKVTLGIFFVLAST